MSDSSSSINNSSLEQFMNQTPLALANPIMNIFYSEQFPDVLQNYSSDECKSLLEHLVDCPSNLINKKGPLGGYTALHWMSIKNELELIEFLVTKCKADVDCKAALGETPLLICIKNCNIYSVDLLIRLGADIKVRDTYNRSILHWSAYSGRVLWFYYFQKHHQVANFNDVDQFFQNPLHIACASGFADMAKFLIESNDLDLFALDINGNTVLHMAARAAMPRTCWLIASKNRGECIFLSTISNKQKLTPYDLIRHEKGLSHRKIKNWLRMEERVNPIIKKQFSGNGTINGKKYNDYITPGDFTLIETIMIRLGLTTQQQGYLEWLFRFLLPFLILSFPVLVNKFVNPYEYSVFKGLLGFGSLPMLMFIFTKQKHRISHIISYENSFYLGFFLAGMAHNYFVFYAYITEAYNLGYLVSMFLTFCHFYFFYKLLNIDQGVLRENYKKSDGTPFNVQDLLKSNNKYQAFTTKDSINWMSEPTNKTLVNSPYFCDACMLITATPAKHCKLCESCCCKFDHHCLFINKCVGLKNHRIFIFLVIATHMALTYFMYHAYFYLCDYYNKLNIRFMPLESQGSLFYYALADTAINWIFVLIFIDIFGFFMVLTLLYFQFKFLSLGYTQQFPQPGLFPIGNKRMETRFKSFMHRLENLHIFFFQSFQANEQLYFRQQTEYFQRAMPNKVIPLESSYPKHESEDMVAMTDFLPTFDKKSISKILVNTDHRGCGGGH